MTAKPCLVKHLCIVIIIALVMLILVSAIANQKAGKHATVPVPRTARANSVHSVLCHKPGQYYVFPLTMRKVRLNRSFRDRSDVLRFVDKEIGLDLSPVFMQRPFWCVVLLDRGSGVHIWDVMVFEKSVSEAASAAPWKLKWICDNAMATSQAEDYPDSAQIGPGARTIIFKTKQDKVLAVLKLPARIAYP